jgi:hypothetical protein
MLLLTQASMHCTTAEGSEGNSNKIWLLESPWQQLHSWAQSNNYNHTKFNNDNNHHDNHKCPFAYYSMNRPPLMV